MAVFEYRASIRKREEYVESGTVVARDEAEAKKKLEQLEFIDIRVKRIGGISGIFKSMTADVR
ncbi:MAG: hypothetical protein HZB26_16310 [Candidatus Hydrogenedentes bacterium]|nr:hypothetical protein [Candidatus Hydrogenedentota bacterium]